MKTTEKQNSLIYKVSKKTKDGYFLDINIRLNDDCNNGHQDFSITANLYEKDIRIDKYFISGGCIHEEIEKEFPEFKQFIDLHLCDYRGIPMYIVENGFYHLKQGVGEDKFCKYYRVSAEEFKQLEKAEDKEYFACMLVELGIIKRYNQEAKKAIKTLEKLTNKYFLIDSKKDNFNFTSTQLKQVKERIKIGYYNCTEVQKRKDQKEIDKKNELIKKITKDFNTTNENNLIEYKFKELLINLFGTFENSIFYSHTKEIQLNWNCNGYNKKYKNEEIELFKQEAKKINEIKNINITTKHHGM